MTSAILSKTTLRKSSVNSGVFLKTRQSGARPGIYHVYEYGPAEQRVQLILVDGRWNLDKQNMSAKGSYLGEETVGMAGGRSAKTGTVANHLFRRSGD